MLCSCSSLSGAAQCKFHDRDAKCKCFTKLVQYPDSKQCKERHCLKSALSSDWIHLLFCVADLSSATWGFGGKDDQAQPTATVEVGNGLFGTKANLHIICCVSQQSSKGDGIGYSSQVDEEDGGKGLDVECVVEVTGKERGFPLDIFYQATKKSEQKENHRSQLHSSREKHRIWKPVCGNLWKYPSFIHPWTAYLPVRCNSSQSPCPPPPFPPSWGVSPFIWMFSPPEYMFFLSKNKE